MGPAEGRHAAPMLPAAVSRAKLAG